MFSPERKADDRGMKNRDDDDNPSLNLWVGNLPPGSVEADLMSLFGKFGVLDSVIAYATRNYAFVNFKRLDDAKKAKEALQGSVIRGSAIRIEFSRPVCPLSICSLIRIFLLFFVLSYRFPGICPYHDSNVIIYRVLNNFSLACARNSKLKLNLVKELNLAYFIILKS